MHRIIQLVLLALTIACAAGMHAEPAEASPGGMGASPADKHWTTKCAPDYYCDENTLRDGCVMDDGTVLRCNLKKRALEVAK